MQSFWYIYRADSRFAASQWEMALLCNDVSHWLGASIESALYIAINTCNDDKVVRMINFHQIIVTHDKWSYLSTIGNELFIAHLPMAKHYDNGMCIGDICRTANILFALTHCSLVMPYAHIDQVPDGTKPLSDPILVNHQWGHVAFSWE